MRQEIKDTVQRKLDQIDLCFPQERLQRSKERLRRLWHGEAPLDRYPFTYAPLIYGYYQPDIDPERVLLAVLDEIIARGDVEDDFIPAFFPGCRQSTIPSMFGAREISCDDDFTCEQQYYHDVGDIERIEPKIAPGTTAHAWLLMQEYVLEMTAGRLPVHVIDMQGPGDVCGKLVGYDTLFCWAYEEPELIRLLMEKATDAFIALWDAQLGLCGDLFVNTHLFGWNWVPSDAGASVSVDSLVMISPAFYREFYQPHLQRIAERYGGLAVHSCGYLTDLFPVLCATPSLKAFNAGQMTVCEMREIGLDERIIASVNVDPAKREETFRCMKENGLRLDPTIYVLWPYGESGIIPSWGWSAEQRSDMQREQDNVLSLLSP